MYFLPVLAFDDSAMLEKSPPSSGGSVSLPSSTLPATCGIHLLGKGKGHMGGKMSMTTMMRPEGLRAVRLTKREIEVLSLIAQGHSSKEAADNLYVSKRTVDFHLANIYDKLQVNNRVQAFRAATRLGLIPFEPSFGAPRAA